MSAVAIKVHAASLAVWVEPDAGWNWPKHRAHSQPADDKVEVTAVNLLPAPPSSLMFHLMAVCAHGQHSVETYRTRLCLAPRSAQMRSYSRQLCLLKVLRDSIPVYLTLHPSGGAQTLVTTPARSSCWTRPRTETTQLRHSYQCVGRGCEMKVKLTQTPSSSCCRRIRSSSL